MKPIYLDYNATTPIDPIVGEAMLPYLHEHFGNPSSGHEFGIATKKAIDNARRQIADMLGCSTEEIVFTSGGSEANNYAIKGTAYSLRHKGNHIITSAVEHPAVTEVCRYLENHGYQVTYLPVDEFGLVDSSQVEKAITPQTILISIMHANNEVGTLEPVTEIAEIARRHNILIHSDCAQSVGKVTVTSDKLGVDMLSIAGHKLYAPKGIGALYVRTGVELEKLVHGADHEMNRRAGTENVLEIVGLGKACELVKQNLPAYHDHLKKTRDRLEFSLREKYPSLKINGHPEKRLPNTASVSFQGLEANTILGELTEVAASAGAACHSDQVDVSSVLEAMNVPLEYAMGTIRFSTGRHTTIEEIDRAVEATVKVVEKMQPGTALVAESIDSSQVKLTQYTHGLGCACKLRPQLLEKILARIPMPTDSKILVGTDSSDDAAVYEIDDNTAIVQTIDFFTPIVDDPFQFGAVAAANSLSDIYAMGAQPLFALNVVGFPSNRLPMEVLEKILEGARSKTEEAGIAIIGGHTVDDTEPKYGLAVTGIVHPGKIITNCGAHVGDHLILTKPIGTGILSTAMKRGLLEIIQSDMLTETMATLNRAAAEAMAEVGVNSATDVTGFGLLGHLLEMMNGSETSAIIESGKVPLISGVYDLAVSGVIPGGTKDNFSHTESQVDYKSSVSKTTRLILNDAQTSGGLLISVTEEKVQTLLDLLNEKGVDEAAEIGWVEKDDSMKIRVT